MVSLPEMFPVALCASSVSVWQGTLPFFFRDDFSLVGVFVVTGFGEAFCDGCQLLVPAIHTGLHRLLLETS